MEAPSIRIEAVPKRNIGRVVLRDDALRVIRQVLDLPVVDLAQVFLIPFQVLEIGATSIRSNRPGGLIREPAACPKEHP